MLRFNVKFDINQNEEKIEERIKRVQARIDSQVLKDSNYYCPLDTSMLQRSGITNTKIGSGKIIWNTPYARFQYYNAPRKNKDKNPNASQKWFEVAKSKCKETWEKIANEEYRQNN